MKIGFLTSVRGKSKFEKQYSTILQYLEKQRHEVVHNLALTEDQLAPMTYPQREELFLRFYKQLLDCDLVVAECSMQSIQVGYGLSFLRDHGKPIIALSIRGVDNDLGQMTDLFSSIENIEICEYTEENLVEMLEEALLYMEPHVDKRFTMIFPAHLLAKVEDVAKKKKLPKAVYIRQLIEKDLIEE